MKTERLYYINIYDTDFDARVISCGKDEKGCFVILDRTLFYPEGGGQPSDRGRLGEAIVIDVQEKDGELLHYVDTPLKEERTVSGSIDWERRFDLMQQHSGEHIVSGLVHAQYGYDNVGFHMGEEFITIDFNGMLTMEQVEALEQKANSYIWQNRKVHSFVATEEEKTTLPYRSKKELTGEVRLVEFPGADLCACCGTHVENTGEIGLVKLVSCHKFKQGVRIEMLSGKRAWQYMNLHWQQNSQISTALSVKPGETLAAVKREQEEIFQLKGRIMELEQDRYERIAGKCQGKGNVLLFEEGLSGVEIRKCTDAVLDTCGGICVLLSGNDKEGYKYAVGERDGDIRALVKKMNEALQGRGGGKPFFAQGSLQASRQEVEGFFEEMGQMTLL